MRHEAYCSFEVSKLLKEKGFDELCNRYYFFKELKEVNYYEKNSDGQYLIETEHCTAPTHQMAMQWLRDEHDIFITVLPDKIHDTIALFWNVYIVTEKEYKWIFAGGGINMTYEELIEEALLYVLKTLIN